MDDRSARESGGVTTPEPDTPAVPNQPAWPDYFPEGCPPLEATSARGVVLRVVANDPPSAQDFLAWCVENGRLIKTKPCQSCSISVFDNMDGVRSLQRRVPAHRGKPVASGDLLESMGVTKPTPSRVSPSHRSWWLPDGIDPSPAFRVVAPIDVEEKC